MSENYIVSARKYRPQTFDTVIGQSHITTTLKNAIKHQQLAHAFLFCGPRGVGKTSCARILAKTINCEHPTADMEACGTCSSCVGFKNNNLFNVFELDAASNNSVEDIRELINQVRFAPQQGRYKVYIVDEVHMLSASAFNAFLKTLEEPPPYAIFILATTEKHKIIPTILSRCQIFDFKRITTNDIVLHLQSIAFNEGMQAEEAALHIIAQKSEGCMRDALSMLDRISGFTNGMLTYSNTMDHLNLLDADFYFQLTDMLLSQDVTNTLLKLDEALDKGFEGDTIINGLAEHFRNLLLCKDIRMAKLLDVPNDHKPIFYEKANQMPPSYIISSLSVINDSELEYKNATNKRLHIEMCLIRLCYVLQATQPNEQYTFAEEKKNFSQVNLEINTAPKSITGQRIEQKAIETTNYKSNEPQALKVGEPGVSSTNSVSINLNEHDNAYKPISQIGNSVSSSKKLRKNMLMEIEESINQKEQNIIEIKNITDADVKNIFENFRKNLQQEGDMVRFAQFSMMRIELLPPDEVRINCTSSFNENYAKTEKSRLIDVFLKETLHMIRITTAIVEDETAILSHIPKVLTKNEIFEAMARKNPNLSVLINTLNMQIEY